MSRDSISNTFVVAGTLCVVCSVLVSGAAVGLRSIQDRQKLVDKQKNILEAAGLYDADADKKPDIEQIFADRVEPRLVDLETGEYVDVEAVGVDAIDDYDARAAARDERLSSDIPAENDHGGIQRRENVVVVYLVKSESGQIDQVVLPIYGKGLWSTLYGFIAVSLDLTEIRGLTFYEHKETPGLGGEVDNANWKQQWKGKSAFGDDGSVKIAVIRGAVDTRDSNTNQKYQIDGLAGATITSRGVTNLLKYWLGPHALGPYLRRLAESGSEQNG